MAGFTLCSFQSSPIFFCIFIGSSLYFSWMALTWGCKACIRFMDRVLTWVSGQKTSLMMTVMATMAKP